jgi:hypothetical protein
MPSAKPRKNSLADAFGVDADELRTPPAGEEAALAAVAKQIAPAPRAEPTEAPTPATTTNADPEPPERAETPPPALRPAVGDDILEIDGHEYVRYADGRLDPAENPTQLNFTITVKERHLLRRLAYEERRSLVSYLREILESRGLI